MNHKRFSAVHRSRQRGLTMLEVSVALLISALAAIGTLRESARVQLMESANIEADNIDQYRLALQHYADDAYQELQRDLPVTRNGVTLLVGAASGQSLRPTVAQLIAMQYLPAGFPAGPLMMADVGGTFENQMVKSPGGCVGLACNIDGLAWVSAPYNVRGTNEANGPVVNQIMSRLGGFGGTSIEGFAGRITGMGGIDMGANPVAGTPAGVVAARFSFNSSALLPFVRIGDARDPNLAGNLTVAGNIVAGGNAAVTGTFTVTGVSTLNGAATLNNNLTVGGTTTLNGATTINSTTTANGDVTVNGNVTSTGRVSGDTIIATGVYAVGAVCANAGAMARSANGMVVCEGGQWRPTTQFATVGGACVEGMVATGAPPANIGLLCVNSVWRGMDTIIWTGVEGAPCPVEGRAAQTAAGKELICKDGTYWSTASLIGPQGVQSINVYSHGQTVPAFACSGGLQPRLIPMGVLAACSFGANVACSNATGAFQGTIDGSGLVSIVGSDGSTPAGGATAQLTVASVCSTY